MKTQLSILTASLCCCFLSSHAQFPQFPDADSAGTYLAGSWTWIRSCGGFAGACQYPATTGITQSITFTKISGIPDTLAYMYYRNGSLNNQGRIGIHHSSMIFGSNAWSIDEVTGFSGTELTFFQAQSDSVVLADNCMDCFSYTLARTTPTITNGILKMSVEPQAIHVFPTPATDRVQIELQSGENALKMTVFSVDGRKISEKVAENGVFDVSDLPAGMYFTEVPVQNGTLRSRLLKN